MSRSVTALAFALLSLPLAAQVPIFPEQIGDFVKKSPKTVSLPDRALYDEYGLTTGEQAEYQTPDKKKFSASGWRFRDSTGALAAFELRRPPAAPKAKLTDMAVATSDGRLLMYGNYVFQFSGQIPGKEVLDQIYLQLPKWENAPLPVLVGYLPQEGLIPNSERYVLGPVSLARFESQIPPSMAAFHLGAEAQIGRYKTPKGELTLTIFNYPTPNMARERAEAFEKLPGAVAKRSGPLVAVLMNPPDADAAERLLGRIRYEANLTSHEAPKQEFNKGLSNMILSIFALAGILICLSTIAGIGLGWFKVIRRKIRGRDDPDALTVIDLRVKTPRV